MSPILGNLIVIAVLAIVVFFAARSVWRTHKSGGCSGCGGNCSGCSGCHACEMHNTSGDNPAKTAK
ncbi:MAG: FeoB-associated Cys-rich membrane protein [Oscillospiraceae bacterium]|nr:FeoB-associated Cys-rich membrane protein [Oscillospiraceae bacterium]